MDSVLIINAAEELRLYLPTLLAARIMAVDLETTGLDPHAHSIRLVQLAVDGLPILVLDCAHFLPEGLAILRETLQGGGVKVFQNAKFDLQFLLALDIRPAPLFDTYLAARLLYMPGMPRRANLETLVQHYLGEEIDKSLQTSTWSGPLTSEQIQYAAKDAAILLRLRRAMVPLLVEHNLTKIADIEFQCVRSLAQMEYCGIHLDLAQWKGLTERTLKDRAKALEALYAYTGRPMAQISLWGEEMVLNMNLDSNPYVLSLLRRHGITVKATSKAELSPYRDHPLVRALSDYRRANKALSTFLEPMPRLLHPCTGRLHPQYGQISAYSGRMSCVNPNIQQIPRDPAFRACFTAPPGRCLVVADYSQIELRVTAQITRDERMLDAYRRGEDLHRLTAALVTGKPMEQVTRQERQAAKAVNFGLIYGMGASGLSQYARLSYGVELPVDQAAAFRDRFFKAYPGVQQWHQRLKDGNAREGRTLAGRRFAFSKTPSLPELSNLPVQGTAADILKRALGRLSQSLAGSKGRVVAVVHDEILLECAAGEEKEAALLLRREMEYAGQDILPLVPVVAEAKPSASWADK